MELQLILDCKTRWSTLAEMIKRFVKLKTAVRKALLDLKAPVSITDDEIGNLEEISNVLDPIKSAVDVLGCRNASLLTADVTIDVLFRKLMKINSGLSRTMLAALTTRVSERRGALYGVMQYLHNGSTSRQNELFVAISRKEIQLTIEMINSRLYAESENNNVGDDDDGDDISEIESVLGDSDEGNMKDQYFEAIQRTLNRKPEHRKLSVKSMISKEMTMFENGGERGKYLERAYKCVLSIPPSSIEAERSFSAAGIICTKLRSRLNDTTLSTILLLRAHFKKTK